MRECEPQHYIISNYIQVLYSIILMLYIELYEQKTQKLDIFFHA